MKKYIIVFAISCAPVFLLAQTTEVKVNTQGDMGVGIATPENKLHVKSESNVVMQVETHGQTATASQINLNSGKIGGQSWLISSLGMDASIGNKKFTIFNNSVDQSLRAHTLVINKYNKVGIGIDDPQKKLDVNGAVQASSFHAIGGGIWPDFVFDTSYELLSLEEVEHYIAEHNHLPEIPSQDDVTENGVDLGEMNAKLLQKVEELTLYLIEQNKQNKTQQMEMEALKMKISRLENK